MQQINLWNIMGEEIPDGVFMTLAENEWKLDSTTGNTTEHPSEPVKSYLREILESNVGENYKLSPTACKGILRRAKVRGKELPPILEQSLLKTAGIDKVETGEPKTEISESKTDSWDLFSVMGI